MSLSESVQRGMAQSAAEAARKALETTEALELIDRDLIPALDRVGKGFENGTIFLPQLLMSAEAAKAAFEVVKESLQGQSQEVKGRIILATVKGDIHDIGKNIVAVVMAVGGCEIIDLGVMVEPAAIVAAVQEHHANFVCLSGLITPSLEQMIVVIRELRRAGITITVIVGGATTSPMHTAVKMAPEYDGLVVHSTDASRNMQIITSLTSPTARVFAAGILADQKRLRELYASAQDRRPLADYRERLAEAKEKRHISPGAVGEQSIRSFLHYDIAAVERHIDWDMFCAEWGVKKEEDKKQLIADAQQMLERLKRENILDLQGVIATLPVHVEGDDIVVQGLYLPMLRNQTIGEDNLSVADFAAEAGRITFFAISAGVGLKQFAEGLRKDVDEYGAFMAKVLADRLAEALAEEVVPAAEGERHAFGYPSCPDHSLKRDVFDLLQVEHLTNMRLTDSYMIDPAESICGMIIPGARYFAVGRIAEDQLLDYAHRRGISPEIIKTLIPRNIQ